MFQGPLACDAVGSTLSPDPQSKVMLRSVVDALLVRPASLSLALVVAVFRVLIFPLLQVYYLARAVVLLPYRVLLYFEVRVNLSTSNIHSRNLHSSY
jgi:hypothetical protein